MTSGRRLASLRRGLPLDGGSSQARLWKSVGLLAARATGVELGHQVVGALDMRCDWDTSPGAPAGTVTARWLVAVMLVFRTRFCSSAALCKEPWWGWA